jgi:hypothetical protein
MSGDSGGRARRTRCRLFDRPALPLQLPARRDDRVEESRQICLVCGSCERVFRGGGADVRRRERCDRIRSCSERVWKGAAFGECVGQHTRECAGRHAWKFGIARWIDETPHWPVGVPRRFALERAPSRVRRRSPARRRRGRRGGAPRAPARQRPRSASCRRNRGAHERALAAANPLDRFLAGTSDPCLPPHRSRFSPCSAGRPSKQMRPVNVRSARLNASRMRSSSTGEWVAG